LGGCTHYSYYTKHKRLSNGQYIGMYFKKVRVNHYIPSDRFTIWKIGLTINKTRKKCNDWYYKQPKNKPVIETGKCGLEGLRYAFQWIKELQAQLKDGEYIIIEWKDEKRKRAYSYLERLGFIDGTYGDEECYFYHK
jgi:hypothetical protein